MRSIRRILSVVVVAVGLAAFFLAAASAQKSATPTLARCNLEAFLVFEISMWRDLDVSLGDARQRIAKRYPDFEDNRDQRLNMMFMGLSAQVIYQLQSLEPIDLSISFYNLCRHRMEQIRPDLML